jgi:uncharacterized protein (DUF1697 family)
MVAMLRSVNVGGRNRLAMADLRSVVTGLGFADVATYVQSGNVVFTGPGSTAAAGRSIADRLEAELGLRVPVLVRSRAQLGRVLGAVPFAGVADGGEGVHVTFLDGPPDPSGVQELADRAGSFGRDRCVVIGHEVYLHCPGGYGETKLNNAYLERRLGATATTRNWRTVTTLAAMAGVAGAGQGADGAA